MRVLVLTHRLPYAPNRGDRIRAYHLVRHLARHHTVNLLSLVHDEDEASHARDLDGIVARVRIARVPRIGNLVRAATALPTTRPLTQVLLDAPDLRPTLTRMVAERRPDVVLAYCSGMAQLAFDDAVRRIPAVIDFVDVDSEKWRELARVSAQPRRWIYRREHRLLGAFEATAARHAKAAIVVNEREQNSLRQIVPGRAVHVVPNGIDLSAFHAETQPSHDPTVVFCGVMNYAPNAQAAIWLAESVWPLVRREHDAARLLLVGADPTPAVRALASRDGSITVTGTVADVRPYLRRSAIAAAPLTTARGIQNKVLEAIASGLPSVVTPQVFEGLPSAAAPACRVAASAARFASAIVDLLRRSPAERRATAMTADLSSLAWQQRLAPIDGILHRAISPERL